MLVALLASRLLHEKLTPARLLAGCAGVLGVALIVLQSQARLDGVGLAAAAGGTVSMAVGTVLAKKWGQPVGVSGRVVTPLATTAWQLIAGGASLALVLPFVEGFPHGPLTGTNILGYIYLSVAGTAFAYYCWVPRPGPSAGRRRRFPGAAEPGGGHPVELDGDGSGSGAVAVGGRGRGSDLRRCRGGHERLGE